MVFIQRRTRTQLKMKISREKIWFSFPCGEGDTDFIERIKTVIEVEKKQYISLKMVNAILDGWDLNFLIVPHEFDGFQRKMTDFI